jgi:hypothetical protein
MEFRDLILNDNTTNYRIVDEDVESFRLLFDNELDNSLPVSAKWEEILLQKSEQRLDCDFCQIEEYDSLIISSKAKESLFSFLAGCNVEYLPCKTENGEYYILNITNLIEGSIMEDMSEFKKSEQGTITNVTNLIFYFESVENKPIFKIKELPYMLFISDEFEEFCLEHNLTGIDFSEDNLYIATDFV